MAGEPILVVDDNQANAALITFLLEKRGYDVRTVSDAQEALAILEHFAPRLIMMDLQLPGMDGLALARRLKAAPKTRDSGIVLLDVMMPHLSGIDVCASLKRNTGDGPYQPVILLTALGAQEDRNRGLEAGADDFLTKPVDRHELLLRVRTFIKIRKQDERIRQQMHEISERDRLIRQQLDELHALDSLKDDLVSLMVHDLRNPLAGISGFLQVIETSAADGELREEAEMALEASGRLRETLDDILKVRMLEGGSVRLQREIVEAGALVRDAIRSISGAARARDVEIEQVGDQSAVSFAVDRKLLRRAIENLLSNALKY